MVVVGLVLGFGVGARFGVVVGIWVGARVGVGFEGLGLRLWVGWG